MTRPAWLDAIKPGPSYYAARVKYEAMRPSITKDQQAAVEAKSGARFSYEFASLDAVLAACLPILAQCGLAFDQITYPDDGVLWLATVLVEASTGEGVVSTSAICAVTTTGQPFGSALSFGRRYGALVVGLLSPADEDDDGARAPNGNGASVKPKGKPSKAEPKPDALDQALADNAAAAKRPKSLSERVAYACTRPAFWRWIGEDHGIAVTSEAEAKAWALDRYRISSRAQLDQPGDAATVAAEDMATFETWMHLG